MNERRLPLWHAVPSALIVVTICGLLLAQTSWIRSTKSITFDETFYLSCGLQTIHDGRLDPRLAAHGVAPLPIVLQHLPALAFAERQARPRPWDGQPGDAQLIRGPRLLTSLLTGIPLVGLVYGWLFRRRGKGAATFGAMVVALSPTIVAHSALATTDAAIGLAATLALLALAHYLKVPTIRRLLLVAAACGWAMAAKYSAIFLFPTIGLLVLDHWFRRSILFDQAESPRPKPAIDAPRSGVRGDRGWRQAWSLTCQTILATAVFCTVWWGLHAFSWDGPLKTFPLSETPDSSPWVRLLGRGPGAQRIMKSAHQEWRRPTPLAGVWFQVMKNQSGHSAYLMGQRSQQGWWYYFPCAFLFKSTPAELVLTGVLVAGIVTVGCRRPLKTWHRLDATIRVFLLALFVFAAMVLTAHINIGQRYLLPAYVWMILLSTDCLWNWSAKFPKRRIAIAMTLVAAQLTSALVSLPDSLAYFNALCGGSQNGWKLLADSNVDWGQDLPALAEELARRDHPPTAIAYFGHAHFPDYGVVADPLPMLPRKLDDYELLAVSVTHLLGVYSEDSDPFREFREELPVARVGYSIFLYDLTRPKLRAAFHRMVFGDQAERVATMRP